MQIELASPSDAAEVSSILQGAAEWLAESGKALWSPADFSEELLAEDVALGKFYAARINGAIAGVMKFQLEDPIFWPEDDVGTSAFIHKLAVHRSHAGSGISTALLCFARTRAESLGLKYLRLDCLADRSRLCELYERFGFRLHSIFRKWEHDFSRYELELNDH